MQTKTINGREIGVVDVPDNAYDMKIIKSELVGWKKTGCMYWYRELPEGQWSILGRAKDITEEQARELVGVGYEDYRTIKWRNFIDNSPTYTALESFQSWLKAEGIKETDLLLIKNS